MRLSLLLVIQLYCSTYSEKYSDDVFRRVLLNYGHGKGNYIVALKCNRCSFVECFVRIDHHSEVSYVLRLPCQREV